jgi:LysM repeat protein
LGRNRFLIGCIVILIFIVVLVLFSSDNKQEETTTKRIVESPTTTVLATTTTTTATTTISESPKHVVSLGETLVQISSVTLEDPARWLELSVFNELENPHVIQPGQVLDIPLEEVDTSGVEVPPMPSQAPAKSLVTTDAPRSPSGSRGAPRTAPAPSSGGTNSHLERIAQCESGGNSNAVSPSGKYHGKYQFSQETWNGVGGSGSPSSASEVEQDKRAQMLYDRSGPGQWPVCQGR